MDDATASKQISKALVEARKSRGLTQAQLAQKIGKSQGFVSNYEQLGRPLSLVDFLRISKTLSFEWEPLLQKLVSKR